MAARGYHLLVRGQAELVASTYQLIRRIITNPFRHVLQDIAHVRERRQPQEFLAVVHDAAWDSPV
jgi:hypothetical protein